MGQHPTTIARKRKSKMISMKQQAVTDFMGVTITDALASLETEGGHVKFVPKISKKDGHFVFSIIREYREAPGDEAIVEPAIEIFKVSAKGDQYMQGMAKDVLMSHFITTCIVEGVKSMEETAKAEIEAMEDEMKGQLLMQFHDNQNHDTEQNEEVGGNDPERDKDQE